MLQIKKKALLICCKYQLLVLFRRKNLSKQYLVKKTVSHSVYVRAPKNFNIGKQRVCSLNFKAVNAIYSKPSPFFINSLFNSPLFIYTALRRQIKTTPVLGVSSIRYKVKTTFKLMWLVTLF